MKMTGSGPLGSVIWRRHESC